MLQPALTRLINQAKKKLACIKKTQKNPKKKWFVQFVAPNQKITFEHNLKWYFINIITHKITLQNIVRAPRDMKYDILLLRNLLSAQLNSLGECTLPVVPSKQT